MQKILTIIPARGGSRRIPRKNLQPVAGKPLIWWTIKAATEFSIAANVDPPMVSTEDSEIADYAKSVGCDVLERPPELATDIVSGSDVAVHAAECGRQHGFEYLIYLQPTSPLRSVEDILRGYGLMLDCGAAVAVVDRPLYSLQLQCAIDYITLNNRLAVVGDDPFVCRSSMQLRGVFWGCRIEDVIVNRSLYRQLGQAVYFVPEERALDIDTPFDLTIADMLMRERNHAD